MNSQKSLKSYNNSKKSNSNLFLTRVKIIMYDDEYLQFIVKLFVKRYPDKIGIVENPSKMFN